MSFLPSILKVATSANVFMGRRVNSFPWTSYLPLIGPAVKDPLLSSLREELASLSPKYVPAIELEQPMRRRITKTGDRIDTSFLTSKLYDCAIDLSMN